jgi:hypothetical protein
MKAWLAAVLVGAMSLAACGGGKAGSSSGDKTAQSAPAASTHEATPSSKRTGTPIAKCPSAEKVHSFVSFVKASNPKPLKGQDALTQREVTLVCRYTGTGELNFYIGEFGDRAQSRFDAMVQVYDTADPDAKPQSREFDKVVKHDDLAGMVDVNYVGDVSEDGTQYVSGLAVTAHNQKAICEVPLFGAAVNGADGAALQQNLEGMLDLMSFVCGLQ